MRIINKFGGEILGNLHLAKLAVRRIREQLKRKQKPVVVVSALAGITDKLEKLCQGYDKRIFEETIRQHLLWTTDHEIDSQLQKAEFQNLKIKLENDLKGLKRTKNKLAVQDRILSYGEKFSSLLFTEYLIKQGIPAKRLTGEEIGIITDDNFGDANIEYKESLNNIRAKLKYIARLPVITGFTGKTSRGETTTLGRGGSDTTACLIGAAINASKIILWKNVPGVLSADPKIVKNPKTIKFLTYEEAEESGKVIHDKSISFVRKNGVSIEVAYIFDPRQKTVVRKDVINGKGVKIINFKDDLHLFIIKGEKITRPGALFEISKAISEKEINMVLIRNTKDILYIVIEKNRHNWAVCQRKISDLGYQILAKEVAMVSVVGRMNWELTEKFNRLLYKNWSKPILGAFFYENCLRLEAIIEPKETKELIRLLHRELI